MVRLVDVRRRVATASPTQLPSDFVREAFDGDRRNARYVGLASVTPTRYGWRTWTVTKIPGQRARRHRQLLYPPRGYQGSLRACRGLKLDCDCGRLLYVFNWVHVDRNLAIYDRTNGQAPVETNPEKQPGACKHLVVALRYLMRDNPRFPHPVAAQAGEAGRDATTGDAGSTGGPAVRLTTIRAARQRL